MISGLVPDARSMASSSNRGIHRVARRAGGDDADGLRHFSRGRSLLKSHTASAVRAMLSGLELMRLAETLARAASAGFSSCNGSHVASRHVSHEQFDGVGAHINHGAADWVPWPDNIGNAGAKSKTKNVTFTDVAPASGGCMLDSWNFSCCAMASRWNAARPVLRDDATRPPRSRPKAGNNSAKTLRRTAEKWVPISI